MCAFEPPHVAAAYGHCPISPHSSRIQEPHIISIHRRHHAATVTSLRPLKWPNIRRFCPHSCALTYLLHPGRRNQRLLFSLQSSHAFCRKPCVGKLFVDFLGFSCCAGPAAVADRRTHPPLQMNKFGLLLLLQLVVVVAAAAAAAVTLSLSSLLLLLLVVVAVVVGCCC